jgi:hypothetical protein
MSSLSIQIRKELTSPSIEFYFFVLLPSVWIGLFALFDSNQLRVIFTNLTKIAYLYSLFGGKLGVLGFLFFYVYLYFRGAYSLASWVGVRFFNSASISTARMKPFLYSYVYFILAIALAATLMIMYIQWLANNAPRHDVIDASLFYMEMDQKLFGFDPVRAIHYVSRYPLIDFLLIKSYSYLSVFFGCLFIVLMLYSKELFRKLVFAAFLAPVLAIPLWHKLPAVTPFELTYENRFSLASLDLQQQQYQLQSTSPRLKEFLETLSSTYENPNDPHPLVTTNPSMHVAWGCIISYYAALLWWPLGFIFVPWLVCTMLSTLYTYQHYSVDIPTGIIYAIMTISLTHFLFMLEKKYHGEHAPMFYFVDVFQRDINNVVRKASALFKTKDRALN